MVLEIRDTVISLFLRLDKPPTIEEYENRAAETKGEEVDAKCVPVEGYSSVPT